MGPAWMTSRHKAFNGPIDRSEQTINMQYESDVNELEQTLKSLSTIWK